MIGTNMAKINGKRLLARDDRQEMIGERAMIHTSPVRQAMISER
jgi:hypothetical protein